MAAAAAHDDGRQSVPSAPTALPSFDYISRQPRRTDTADRDSTPTRSVDREHSPRGRPLPSPHAVRPASPYTFGTASSLPAHEVQRRRLLRSPASDNHPQPRSDMDLRANDPNGHGPARPPNDAQSAHADDSRSWTPYEANMPPRRSQASEDRDRDVDMLDQRRAVSDRASLAAHNDDPQFDYSMRRHSIAAVHPLPGRLPSPSDRMRRNDAHRGSIGPTSAHTLKRKMSHDRIMYQVVGEEAENNSMAVDSDEPAPKRRGSAFDTRIAQLSLYDRRDSVDSRSPVSQLWADRRDSTSSMFSNLSSVPSYSPSGFSGDAHAKGAPPFPWTASHAGQETRNEADSSRPSPFDPRGSSTPSDLPHHSAESRSIPSLPPMHPYATDRRMSVPDASSKSAERSLRPRSRPPSSRDGRASPDSETPEPPAKKPTSDPRSAPADSSPGLDTVPHSQLSAVMGASTTPYSRSPELRVSHKLAERKRRKEMKDLFDELRDQLPADRGMKASKWEILSKAIDYIQHLKTTNHELHRDVESLRHEVDTMRGASGAAYPPSMAPAGVQVYPPAPPTAPYQVTPVSQTPRGSVVHPYSQPASTAQATAAHRSGSPM